MKTESKRQLRADMKKLVLHLSQTVTFSFHGTEEGNKMQGRFHANYSAFKRGRGSKKSLSPIQNYSYQVTC